MYPGSQLGSDVKLAASRNRAKSGDEHNDRRGSEESKKRWVEKSYRKREKKRGEEHQYSI